MRCRTVVRTWPPASGTGSRCICSRPTGLRVPQQGRATSAAAKPRCAAGSGSFEADRASRAVRHKQLGDGDRTMPARQAVRRALNGLLSRKRTWTAAQLAEVLAEEKGLVMKPDTVRKYLHLMGASYRRTKYSLRHRQDPAQAAARTWLGTLKKSP